MQFIDDLIFSGSTSDLLDYVEYGSYVRLAQPLIPLGLTIWSIIQSANANTGVFPVWFWVLPLAYFIIDVSSAPLNVYYLMWSKLSNSDMVTKVNDKNVQLVSFGAYYINIFMLFSPLIMSVLTFLQQLVYEFIDWRNEPDYEFGYNIRLSYSIITTLPFLLPAVF